MRMNTATGSTDGAVMSTTRLRAGSARRRPRLRRARDRSCWRSLRGRRPPRRSSIRCCSSSACRRPSSSSWTRRCGCSRTATATSTIRVLLDDRGSRGDGGVPEHQPGDRQDLSPRLPEPALRTLPATLRRQIRSRRRRPSGIRRSLTSNAPADLAFLDQTRYIDRQERARRRGHRERRQRVPLGADQAPADDAGLARCRRTATSRCASPLVAGALRRIRIRATPAALGNLRIYAPSVSRRTTRRPRRRPAPSW